jgi:putative ABC transport system permease protein
MIMKSVSALFNIWVWKMAWRDSRTSRRRLILSTLCIVVGIAALVAISSFGKNLQEAVDQQAKSLLGADLVISSRQPFTTETEELIGSIPGAQSREISFSSMAYFPKTGGTRLVQVRALQGDFPYYGLLETLPRTAAHTFKTGPQALVDNALMLQFDVRVGDPIKIGASTFRIAGRLKKIPGEAPAAALIGPRVYLPMTYLSQTQLIQKGSRVTYKVYFKLAKEIEVEQLLEKIQPHLTRYRLENDTVQKRKTSLGEVMGNLVRFLNLVAFIAPLLGGVGVASGIHVYIKQKFNTIALLRCVGATAKQTFAVYLTQATAMGLGGAILGALAGIGMQTLLPTVLADFLPVRMTFALSWSAVVQGVIMGLGITLLFALLPLLSIGKISPLLTLRFSYEDLRLRSPLRWGIYLLIAVSIGSFAMVQTEHWTYGLGFFAALGLAFGLLTAVARLTMVGVKNYFPNSWTYVWRQGLANLYRPNNQTVVLVLSLGLGTFLLLTLYLSQSLLLKQVSLASSKNQPNLVLFDIQRDQKEDLAGLLRSFGLPVLQWDPIVTMRLASVKGKDVAAIRNDSSPSQSDWALHREYHATYRDSLSNTEAVTAGAWQGKVDGLADRVTVSLEEEIARTLSVTLGDQLVFDVQGVPITTTLSSIRKVDWWRIQPNFFVVFPTGVLEDAPQYWVLVTRFDSPELSAELQQTVVQKFPNVLVIDLTLVLSTVEAVLRKVSFAIRFIALFSVLTGLIVLVGVVISGRYQRVQESLLLRTLGASRAQVNRIMMVEYLFLGSFSGLAGILLALAGTWGLAYFMFDITFVLTLRPLISALLLVTGLAVLAGIWGNWGVHNRPPLEALRADV